MATQDHTASAAEILEPSPMAQMRRRVFGHYGIIIGGATINCGSTTTAPSSVDSSVLNNNPDTVSDLINQLKRANRVGRCPSNTELINVARLNDYVFRDGCSNLASSPLSAGGDSTRHTKEVLHLGCSRRFTDAPARITPWPLPPRQHARVAQPPGRYHPRRQPTFPAHRRTRAQSGRPIARGRA